MFPCATGNHPLQCQVGGGTAKPVHETAADTFEIATWYHFACTYDHPNQEIDAFIDGANEATGVTAATDGLTTIDPRISWTAGATDTYADDVFLYSGELTEPEIARIAACDIDGSECSCNGASWVDKGRVDANCTGSGTPWACCTGSGTGCINDALLTEDCNKASP